MTGRGRRTDRRRERGAAAVEFALVAPILFMVLTGILQYGIFFNDAQNARQAARETLRQAVVNTAFNESGCTGTTTVQMRCVAVKRAQPMAGTAYARVVAPGEWKKPNSLKLCVWVKSNGGFGLLPLPNDGWLKVRMEMSIEQPNTTPGSTGEDSLSGTGQNWDYCNA